MTELKKQVKIKILTSTVIKSPWANGYCRKYFLELNYNNKKFSFPFTDSVAAYCKNEKLDKLNALYCVLSDADAYDNTQNIDDFAAEFGYEKVSELLKAYRACEKTAKKCMKYSQMQSLNNYMKNFKIIKLFTKRMPASCACPPG